MPWYQNRRGEHLWYEDTGGTGLPVVMVHGWCMSAAVWKYQYEGLRTSLRIVTPDLRGHGHSREISGSLDFDRFAEDLIDLFDGIGFTKAILVGWSMGAQVALASYAELSDRLAGMVLVSATPCFSALDDFPYGLASKETHGMHRKVQRNTRRALDGFYTGLFADGELDSQSDMVGLLCSIPVPDTDAALAALGALIQADMRSLLPRITTPTLIVNGSQDRICTPQASLYLKEHIPRAQQYLFPECGHAPFLSRSHQFNAELIRFVRSVCE